MKFIEICGMKQIVNKYYRNWSFKSVIEIIEMDHFSPLIPAFLTKDTIALTGKPAIPLGV